MINKISNYTIQANKTIYDALNKIKATLESNKLASTVELSDEEKEMLSDFYLLTAKPMMYVANVSEEQLKNIENDAKFTELKEYAKTGNNEAR